MPFYFDISRQTATSPTQLTQTPHLFVQTVAQQETVGIGAIFVTARGSGAGGGSLRIHHNMGTIASGGTAQTPQPKNLGSPAAASVWANDATAITPGATLVQRVAIGFAQTGGMGGWVAPEPSGAFQMKANKSNPVDLEVSSIAAGSSVPIDITVEFTESR